MNTSDAQSRLDHMTQILASEIHQVRHSMRENLGSQHSHICAGFESLFSSQAKFLRVVLSLWCSRLVGFLADDRITLGVISEYIHMASLLHDDVVDGASTRRGRRAYHCTYGASQAVLVGDYVYARACELIARLGSLEVLNLYARSIRLMSEGEVIQLSLLPPSELYYSQLTESMFFEQYDHIIRAKTGSLLAAIAAAPYELCHRVQSFDESKRDALYHYGMNLGRVFQITDDMMDYTVSSHSTKPIYQDFRQAKMTLPLYYCFQNFDDDERQQFFAVFFDDQARIQAQDWMVDQIQKHNALARSLEYASEIAYRASCQIEQAFGSNSQCQALQQLVVDLVNRFK